LCTAPTCHTAHGCFVCQLSRDLNPDLIELFIDGNENPLPDPERLDGLGLGSGSVVFMLQRAGWRWEVCGSSLTLSEDGLLVTSDTKGSYSWQLVTGGEPMTEGRHYWEVELTQSEGNGLMIGAVRPDMDYEHGHMQQHSSHLIDVGDWSLYGSGKRGADQQGWFAEGDRVGVLLDLDAGWLRFYRNNTRCGPGFTEGVTGPLVRAAQIALQDTKLTVLPGAVAPEGAGGVAEPWSDRFSGGVGFFRPCMLPGCGDGAAVASCELCERCLGMLTL
jgi:hypothetical protein